VTRLVGKVVLVTGAPFISGAEIPLEGGMTAHGRVTSISDAVGS